MTSAFIIQVQPQLQQDPNEETAALLRVLIHKIDNTTFGGDVPALPQWTGPARMVVQVQSILYASLAASLFSAFLAMLGKQWLNRYASIDMRGSAIERSQDRQRKLDGIIRWYFNHVLESLPLMLQVALLLLGCALSRYLWDINTVIASVVVGVTSFGLLFYLCIIVTGATSDGCPYLTPWTNIIRRLSHLLLRLFIERSFLYLILFKVWGSSQTGATSIIRILVYPLMLLAAFAWDAFRVGRAMFRSLAASAHKARGWLFGSSSIPEQALDSRPATLDFRCISWMLRTSLDKSINLLALKFLKTILASPGFDTDIVVDCFNIFSNCFVTSDLSIAPGSEQLVGISAMCFFYTFSSLSITESTSTTLEDVRQRYGRMFLPRNDLQYSSYPFYVNAVHRLFFVSTFRSERLRLIGRRPPPMAWTSYNPSFDELVPFAHTLAQVAQFEYRRKQKVPRWLIRFALRFLSQDPLPPTSVVIDCLTMIATDLGCNPSDTDSVASDEKYVNTPKTTVSPLTLHQRTA